MEMEQNEIETELAWQLSSEHYDFVLYEDWWFWQFRARSYLVKECDKQFVAFYRYVYIATKLHFADFDSCTVVRYLATTADVRQNLTRVCLSVSPIGTDFLANTPIYGCLHLATWTNLFIIIIKYFSGITVASYT